jgi:protein NrfD
MGELIITRHNHLVDPGLHVWAWQIPVYLFLGGWVAGLMILIGVDLLRGRHRLRDSACTRLPWLGLVLISLGMLALWLDLEHKTQTWRLYTTFQVTSPMSWGAWILVLVYPALAAAALLRPPSWLAQRVAWLARAGTLAIERPERVRVVAVANIALGAALGTYTGVLLSSLGARPLWTSGLLGPLFLISGLSSAAAFVHLVARRADERERLTRLDTLLLGLEIVVIGLLLAGLAGAGAAQREALALLMGGPYTAVFWVGVIGLGLVLPLVVQGLSMAGRVPHTAVAPVMVLGGGLLLRFVIVAAGQESHWSAAVQTLVR